jgi:hypothetical protein
MGRLLYFRSTDFLTVFYIANVCQVTAPSLSALLLKFILTGSVDGKSIKDVLLSRLHLTSQVSKHT